MLARSEKAVFVHRWPWRIGRCTGCDDSSTWVLPCFQCGDEFCEEHTLDTARCCKLPICNRCLRIPHVCGAAARGTLYGEFLRRKACRNGSPNSILCDYFSVCRSTLDIGISHSCAVCKGAQCLDVNCASQVMTSYCCAKDVCKACLGFTGYEQLPYTRCVECRGEARPPLKKQRLSAGSHDPPNDPMTL